MKFFTTRKTLFLLMLLFSQVSFGQDSTQNKIKYRNEFGFNATRFIEAFAPFAGYNSFNSPYFFKYRRYYNKGNLRLTIGTNFNSNGEFVSGNYDGNSSGVDFYYKIGWEKVFPVSKRFQAFYGIDILNNYLYSGETDEDNIGNFRAEEKVFTYAVGFSPLAGLRFFIFPKLSITTEACFDFIYTKRRKTAKVVQSNDQLEENVKIMENASGRFQHPLAIYIHYTF